MTIIDAHMHLWARPCGRQGLAPITPLRYGMVRIGGQVVQGMPTWFRDCRNHADLAVAAMDEAGVSGAVVTQEYMDGNQNEYLRRVMRAYPGRFFVHGLLDFTKPSGLKKEMARVVRLGFRGIKCPAMFLPSLSPPIPLDSVPLMEIWEEMEGRGMVLSIDMAAGSVQVPQMRKVLHRFPRLKVAIGHFGMVGAGRWMDQIRLAEHDSVSIECGGIIWRFRQEGPPFRKAQAAIRQALKAIGHRKIMWGSDYPRTMVDFTYRQSLDFALHECDFFSREARTAFLGGNAAKLYGISAGGPARVPRTRITEL
jgi:predicted TIM-barrel fold metal-dependent hydrolase